MAFASGTVKKFLDDLASDSPAPGGGSVAALGGALGAGLVSMVSRLTVGREKYRGNWEAMEAILSESEPLREKLAFLMDEDTKSFNALMAALKLPKESEAEKSARREAIEDASKASTEVPLATLEACAGIAKLASNAARLGNPNAASDAGSAALLAEAAGKAAAYNVRINLPGIKDAAFVSKARERMKRALGEISQSCLDAYEEMDRILGDVET
ncbi:MAG: cyclodeaminase/cyclohydrolase family protein [Synergistaceae bacterium]|nr:cyclodeaminase/cyclohydrolase family protein [Synergistaceae bacterium]